MIFFMCLNNARQMMITVIAHLLDMQPATKEKQVKRVTHIRSFVARFQSFSTCKEEEEGVAEMLNLKMSTISVRDIKNNYDQLQKVCITRLPLRSPMKYAGSYAIESLISVILHFLSCFTVSLFQNCCPL